MSEKKPDKSGNSVKKFENEPTSLEESSHLEMITLFKESASSIRFAKHMQWWTVGSTLLAFGAIIGIAKLVSADQEFTNILKAIVILLTTSVILTLVIYQFWQHTNLLKMEEITKNMSSLFVKVRRIKSKREANIHRYLLILFMVSTLALGATVTYLGLEQMLK